MWKDSGRGVILTESYSVLNRQDSIYRIEVMKIQVLRFHWFLFEVVYFGG